MKRKPNAGDLMHQGAVGLQAKVRAQQSEIASLRAENEKLKAALEVYADKNNWHYGGLGDDSTTFTGTNRRQRNGFDLAASVLKEIDG